MPNDLERRCLLADMIRQVAPHHDLDSLEVVPSSDIREANKLSPRSLDQEMHMAETAVRALVGGEPSSLSDDDVIGLEAIVLPSFRPVVDIVNGDYATPPHPWAHLAGQDYRYRIKKALPSIGRVEVPNHHKLPFAGTAFVVGDELLMTNRHVAESFASGVGQRWLNFLPGQTAACDFARELHSAYSLPLSITEVVMIHPHWDMALLRVRGLGSHQMPLTLDVNEPEDFVGRDIVVIGYPAHDSRNNLQLQNQIFRGIFDVKRLQPGKVKPRVTVRDRYKNIINPMTHDSSTLGGNSGSAVVDVLTGNVIGLHFAGAYLRANYAVPTRELASDPRVVDAGVNFSGTVPPTQAWNQKWRKADNLSSSTETIITDRSTDEETKGSGRRTMKWTIPLEVSVTVGDTIAVSAEVENEPDDDVATPNVIDLASINTPANTEVHSEEEQEISLRIPKIFDNLHKRKGFQTDFLDIGGLDMPHLTRKGKKVAAKLDDDSHELKYHKFSVYLHKLRRLAIFTAANVDYREDRRMVNGRRPTRVELSEIPSHFGEQWVTDPRIPHSQQLPDIFSSEDRKSVEKRHIVRPSDVCWGDTFADIQMANGDTYHTTNCSPLTGNFKQASQGTNDWCELEGIVQKQAKTEKALVFSGPVFRKKDPEFEGRDNHGQVKIKIPQSYWKIVVVNGREGPEAFGFVLGQDLSKVASSVSASWQSKQVTVKEIDLLVGKLVDVRGLIKIDSLG